MKQLFISISLLILSCNSKETLIENQVKNDLETILVSNEYLTVGLKSDSLFCRHKDKLFFSSSIAESLSIEVNHLDSTVFINDFCFNPFTGIKIPANKSYHIRQGNHMPNCAQNDIVHIYSVQGSCLIINNYKESETCHCNPIQSVLGGDSLYDGCTVYYSRRDGRFESYIFDIQKMKPISEKKYQTIGSFEDIILGYYYYRNMETNWNEMIVDVYKIENNQILKVAVDSMNWGIDQINDYYYTPYYFAQLLDAHSNHIEGAVKLNVKIVGMKVNSKWQIYELEHINERGGPELLMREENIDSVIGIPGDPEGYVIKRNNRFFLKFSYGNQAEYEFDSLVVNRYKYDFKKYLSGDRKGSLSHNIFIYSLAPSNHIINDLQFKFDLTTEPLKSINVPEDYELDTTAVFVISIK